MNAASPRSPAEPVRDGPPPLPAGRPVVFFDGACGVCDRFVDLLVRLDRRGALHLAPLQGETARDLLPPLASDHREWSVVYLDERGVHRESEAVIEIARRLGGVWELAAFARIVPRFARDAAYRTFARHRDRWFGRRETCRIPSPEERARFLP